jgi:hypothetical protein
LSRQLLASRRPSPALALPAELGSEAAAGLASAADHRALDVVQLDSHLRLERAGEGGGKL